VIFSGVTVGDVASWVDSLLVAGLLRFGAESFSRVLDAGNKRKQLAYTFQVGWLMVESVCRGCDSLVGRVLCSSSCFAVPPSPTPLPPTPTPPPPQGINRLGIVFQQLAVAASTVSIVITLEAAVEWPPLVTVASALFFAAAVGRSAAMWWVLTKYGKKLDDVEESLEAHRWVGGWVSLFGCLVWFTGGPRFRFGSI